VSACRFSQLLAAGERVLDVQPKLASRVRLLQAGDTNKNDPNDALSVAVAALRSKARREVSADDYPAVLKVWSRRHRDLARTRNQVACRLHAVLCDLVPGGHLKEISAAQAAITQIRHRHSEGRAYYDKKLAEGKTHKEALRSLKRQISDAIFARLQADARKAVAKGPGGQPGNDSASSAVGSHPARRHFGQATPGPCTTIQSATTARTRSSKKPTSTKYRAST
jgi:Transposase